MPLGAPAVLGKKPGRPPRKDTLLQLIIYILIFFSFHLLSLPQVFLLQTSHCQASIETMSWGAKEKQLANEDLINCGFRQKAQQPGKPHTHNLLQDEWGKFKLSGHGKEMTRCVPVGTTEAPEGQQQEATQPVRPSVYGWGTEALSGAARRPRPGLDTPLAPSSPASRAPPAVTAAVTGAQRPFASEMNRKREGT